MKLALAIALILSAGPGARLRSGGPPVPGSMQGNIASNTAVSTPVATFPVPISGTLASLHGEATAAGTDGGGATFTLAVVAYGGAVPGVKCSLEVDCAESSGFQGGCSATFEAGQDLHMEITASSCATTPTAIVRATWLW